MNRITVRKFCFCANVTTGCYVLSFFLLLSLIKYLLYAPDIISYRVCRSCACYIKDGVVQTYIFVMFFSALVMLVDTLHFVYGVYTRTLQPVNSFVLIMTMWLFLFVSMQVLAIATLKRPAPVIKKLTCPNLTVLIVETIVVTAVYLYMLLIVYSFREILIEVNGQIRSTKTKHETRFKEPEYLNADV